jgi:hypothetical protein
MSVLYQVVDIVIGGLIAGATTFVLSAATADQQLAVTVGVVLASMYYFSRNPWGSDPERAAEYNARIDGFYGKFLP